MTPREIILANLNHTPSPRCGMNFSNGRMNDMLIAWLGPSTHYTPRRWIEGDKEYYDDEWGNIWVRMRSGSVKGEIHQPVLTDWSQLDSLQVPDSDDPARYEPMRQTFAQPTDKLKVAAIGGWIFDNARYLRRMEVYFMDMALYPDELLKLHEKVARVYEARIHASAKAGAQAIFIGEDMGTQNGLLFSPDMFRFYFKSPYTRLLAIAHDYNLKVLLHSCGKNWDILDDLIDAGIDCFQFDQPAVYDMPALAHKLATRKVGLFAPVDIQKILPTGNRPLIESETDKMLQIFRHGLIMKNYPDLPGIGVKEEWDHWAYTRILNTFPNPSVPLYPEPQTLRPPLP